MKIDARATSVNENVVYNSEFFRPQQIEKLWEVLSHRDEIFWHKIQIYFLSCRSVIFKRRIFPFRDAQSNDD